MINSFIILITYESNHLKWFDSYVIGMINEFTTSYLDKKGPAQPAQLQIKVFAPLTKSLDTTENTDILGPVVQS